MADKTYADLTAATDVQDADLLASWRPAGPGPLKKIQASVVKGYMLDGIGTAADEDIGTSGHTVPLLDGQNAWSMPQVFTGITDGSSAAAGKVGEVISTTVIAAGAVSVPSVTPTDVGYIDLTAGFWLLWGNTAYAGNATGAINALSWISATSATLPTAPNGGAYASTGVPSTNTLGGNALPAGMMLVNITTTTRYYLGAYSSYSGGAATAYGYIAGVRLH